MKKVALLLLSMIFALMLLSCQAVQPGGAGEGHVHTYEGQLQYNETAHFYRCTCGKAGTPEVHADINNDGVCDACGFGMELIICEHQWVEYCDKPTTCALCGRWEWGSEPRGHEYDDEVTAPTCTEAGFTTHVCKHCGYTHVDTIVDALGHTPVVDDAVAPTCVNTGLTEGSHCGVCDEILTAQEVVDALGHDWAVATCNDPATCKVCGETTGVAIGHDPISHEGKPATCLDKGYKAYETCSRCDYTTYEEIPALGHKPGEIVVENNVLPDCDDAGSYDNVVYCTVCGEELSRVTVTVDALGHTVVVDAAVAPDCVNTGLTEGSHCDVCKEVLVAQTVVDALGHTEVVDEAVAPDCVNAGLTEGKHCSVCEEVIVAQTVVSALGHKPGEIVVENNVAPDCDDAGSYDNVVYCTVCEEELSRTTVTVDALGHKPGAAKVENNVDPDCVNAGSYENVVYCTVCGEEVSRVTVTVDALGHKAGEIVVENNVDPDCENDGSYDNVVYCTVCKVELSRETVTVDALGHDKVAHEAQAATCTAIGWEAYETCSRCDYSTYVEIPALGHDKVSHEAKVATCTAIGWEAYETCSRCDYSTYVEIPALGHTEGEAVKENNVLPDCENAGSYDRVVYCSVCDEEVSRETVNVDALGHTWALLNGNVYECETCKVRAINNDKAPATLSFASTENRLSWDASQQTWANNGVTFINTKTSSSSNIIDSSNPVRLYKNSIVAIEAQGIVKIVFNCSSNDYATDLQKAIGNIATVNGKVVTVVFESAVDTFEITLSEGQVRLNSLTVTFEQKGYVVCLHDNWNDATCTAPKTCSACGLTEGVELGHSYDEVVTAPTCTEEGYTTHTCSVCGDSYKDTAVDALGHTEGEAVKENEVDPDCENAGSYDSVVYCSVCKAELSRETVTVDALGHTEGEAVKENEVDPDCENDGSYENVVYCSVCEKELSRTTVTVDKLGHVWAEELSHNAEKHWRECTRENCDAITDEAEHDFSSGDCACGEEKPACEHDWSEATCTEASICLICGETGTAALGHTEGDAVQENSVAPGCESTGSYDSVVYCSACNEELSRTTVTVDATGHTAVIDEAVAPTCTETGLTEGKHCSVCSKVLKEQESGDALGHSYGEGVVTAPTCTEKGFTTYTCTV